MPGDAKTTPSNVVLHPVLRAQAERLLRDPALSAKVRREIRHQLGLEPPSPPLPVQLSLLGGADA